MRRSAGILASLLAGLAGACSGESDHDGAPTSVSAGDFASEFASTYCSSISGCCQRFGEAFNLSSCQDAVRGYISAAVDRELASGKVVFDDAAAGACIDAYGAALSACTDQELGNRLDGACENIFHGTVELGGSCADSDECVDPAGATASCDTGVCVANEPYHSPSELPHAALGEACTTSCTVDGLGSNCRGSGLTDGPACWANEGVVCGDSGQCEPAPAIGDPCPEGYCESGAYCGVSLCAATKDVGPCTSSVECSASSYCDYTSGQCTPLKPDGTPCEDNDECAGGDCAGDQCRAWSVASPDTCAGLLD